MVFPTFGTRPPLDELLSVWESLIAKVGTTTTSGDPAGNSFIDSGLIGSGNNSFLNMGVVLYPGDPARVDARAVSGFDNGNGEVTLDAAYKGVAAAIPAGVPYIIVSVAGGTAAVKTQTDKLPNIEHETEWGVGSVVQQVASAASTPLTARSVTPTFPTGSTRIRAILIASIHVANQAANAHHINLKVQGQKAGGVYVDQLDLTVRDSLGLVNINGAADGWSGAIDVTTLVDTSGVQYDFRFVVDSDNAGAVNYTQNFVLVLVYRT